MTFFPHKKILKQMALIGAVCLSAVSRADSQEATRGENPLTERTMAAMPIAGTYHDDLPMWNHIIRSKPSMEMPVIPKGAIIPHHAMVARDLGSFYKGLSEVVHPKTIYILCPNHFETTDDTVVTASEAYWETVYGDLKVNRELCSALVTDRLAVQQDQTFIKEHGIYIHAPFIKYYFPEAQIVPILFRWKNDPRENDKIASWIANRWNDDSFVIGSVDFSHYQPEAVADFHDEASRISISGFMPESLYDREIDSPSSVYTLMEIMDRIGSRAVTRMLHTNSNTILGFAEKKTTSHQYYVFSEGEAEPVKGIAVLVGGPQKQDAPFIATQENWSWKREIPIERKEDDFLFNLRGEEDRFLVGADLCLFALPEQEDEFQYTFPGGKLVVFRVDESSLDSERWISRIETAKNEKKNVIVVYETDQADRDSVQSFFYLWIEAGADTIIRRGPGPVSMGNHRGKPVISSMGGFTGGSGVEQGVILGLFFEGESLQTRIFPISVKEGYPELSGEYDGNP